MVHRESYHEVPPRVEYSLTELGRSLNLAPKPLGDWGAGHLAQLASATGRPPVALHAEGGA